MNIKRLCFFCLWLLAFCASELSAQEQAHQEGNDAQLRTISKTINEVMQIHDIPAISACVIVGDKVQFINFGHTTRLGENEVNEKSVYQIASLSKAFVGMTVHKLAFDQVIKLDDSITFYLPEQVSSETMKRLQPVSMLDLIQHRSGLPRDTLNANARRDGTYSNYDYSELDMLNDLENMPLRSRPGEQFSYSNYGYSFLAYLLERATEKEFDQLMEENVTQRLGMTDTVFETTADQQARLVSPFDMQNPGVAREPARIGKLSPPTAIYCTTADLALLMKSQMAEYRSFQVTKQATPLVLTHNTKEAWANSGISYGYGFFDWGNGSFGHSGGMDGYGSEYAFDPDGNFGFILLTSSCGSWSQRLNEAVFKSLDGTGNDALSDLVVVEKIVALFEAQGPQAALKLYQELRSEDPSFLGMDGRNMLINLARQNGLDDAAEMFAQHAAADQKAVEPGKR